MVCVEKIEKWINENKPISCASFGTCDGFGSGDGSGSGFGSGSGDGSGDGSCFGYGDGYGSGYGSGYGDGVLKISGMKVFNIDNIPTIITSILGDFAKGYILQSDLQLNHCFVAKGDGLFAHGRTLEEAVRDLNKKKFARLQKEEVFSLFMDKFDDDSKYECQVFFEWHSYITGSCLQGRLNFVEAHGIDLERNITVRDFFDLTREDFGGEVIEELEEEWKEKWGE